MRKLLVIVVVATLAAGLAATALAASRTVRVGDNWFVRPSGVPTVTVERGDTVVWRFTGRRRHNVTVRRGPVRFHSPTKRSGTYRRRMNRRGTYVIVCTIHGARDQKMRLVVR
jgi:plastocyanin